MEHEITLYLEDLSGSPQTARAYRTALVRFSEFTNGKPVAEIGSDDLIGFTRQLKQAELAYATVYQYTTAVLGFLNWLILEKLIALTLEDLARWRRRLGKVRGRRPQRTLPPIPSTASIMALLEQAHRAPSHTSRLALLRLRNIAIIQTLRWTGGRVSEVVGLKCGDLKEDHKVALIVGKGGRQRVLIFRDAWADVQAYLHARGACQNGEPLFVAHDRAADQRRHLSPTTVRNVLRRLAEEAGIEEEIRPHLFRHRLGTELAWQTGNARLVQDALGHADISTTQLYMQVGVERLMEAMEGVEL